MLCTNNEVSTDSLEHVTLNELGAALCKQNTSELSPPYLLVVPHGAVARKKVTNRLCPATYMKPLMYYTILVDAEEYVHLDFQSDRCRVRR